MNNANLVQAFIGQWWNGRDFTNAADFFHPDYFDHSLPPTLVQGPAGTQKWIELTGASFAHHTVIEDQVTEGNKTVVQIRMQLKHIGTWRDIEATGIKLETTGYRFFEFRDGKIIAHRALIDGQTIENKLRQAAHGCKVGG